MDDSIYTRQQFWGSFEEKEAEVGGIMPNTTKPGDKPDKGAKFTIPKTGSATMPDVAEPVPGEQAPKNPQAQPVKPRIDVSAKEPPKVIKEKQAQYLALPSVGRYPLDSYEQVKQAAAYYQENRQDFIPEHRREYCVNLMKRASVLGIPVSEEVQQYGGTRYASSSDIQVALDLREQFLDDSHQHVLGKVASLRPVMEPEDFATLLGEFDKVAGIDCHYGSFIPDPFISVFTKEAESEEDGSHIIGNDIVSNTQLKAFANSPHFNAVEKQYGEDFAGEFKKDPIGIFKSLPADQKKIIARQANEPVSPN